MTVETTDYGFATKLRCTQRKRYRTCMLLNVAAHNVSIRNIKVSKRERHITYSVTKHTYVLLRLSNVHFTFCNGIRFVTLHIM